MNADESRFAVYPGGRGATFGAASGPEIQELWFSLARLPWASLVLVPADRTVAVGWLATSLADVGTRLRDTAVTAIVANGIDYASARLLAELQPRLAQAFARPDAQELEKIAVAPAPSGAPAPAGVVREATPLPPIGRAILAIEPVVDQPLGLAVAHAADAVVLCVQLGSTATMAARRTLDLVGADHVLGTVIVR